MRGETGVRACGVQQLLWWKKLNTECLQIVWLIQKVRLPPRPAGLQLNALGITASGFDPSAAKGEGKGKGAPRCECPCCPVQQWHLKRSLCPAHAHTTAPLACALFADLALDGLIYACL